MNPFQKEALSVMSSCLHQVHLQWLLVTTQVLLPQSRPHNEADTAEPQLI